MKVLAIKIKRQQRDGMLTFLINSFFCFVILLCVMLLILFISGSVKRCMLSEDLNVVPRLNRLFLSIDLSSSARWEGFTGLNGDEIRHSMSDEELLWRASRSPQVVRSDSNGPPKVAFMFLAKGRLPLGPIWEKFFEGYRDFYSIYLHSFPTFNEKVSEFSTVEWGKASMIDAERRLLANALLNFSNERFVLLSDTCIPLFNFTTIYNYLINSSHSFIGSFDDPRPIGRGRYNKRMWPTITISDWRKGSQWLEVQRKLAIDIISDKKYYPIFREHCKKPCYMDEHYFATLATKLQPEMNSNRSLTWVDWSTQGPHPATFRRNDISEEFLMRIRREANCTYNGRASSVCFLFARKFHPNTLKPLLNIAPSLYGF
ncbi:hypothetical protein ACHQM5_005690 [Ranunculus cassubicifolius]